MNTSIFVSQFKSYCYNLQNDCDKMKRSVDKKSDYLLSNNDDESFMLSIENQLQNINLNLQQTESLVFGPAESRLSHVSLEEVYKLRFFILHLMFFNVPLQHT